MMSASASRGAVGRHETGRDEHVDELALVLAPPAAGLHEQLADLRDRCRTADDVEHGRRAGNDRDALGDE